VPISRINQPTGLREAGSIQMAEHAAFALGHSNLNGFLFADIGVERSGMNLSVMSALARVGLDPWQEAARLAGLPRAAATEVLARLIAAMPSGLWPMPVATPIAARLVTLLPGQNDGSPAPEALQLGVNWRWLLIAALTVVMALALLAQSIPTPAAPSGTAALPAATPAGAVPAGAAPTGATPAKATPAKATPAAAPAAAPVATPAGAESSDPVNPVLPPSKG
jgi:hypothetical protein